MKEKEQVQDEKLRLMVFKSAWELGKKIDGYLLDMYNYDKDKYTFIVPINEVFFSDGHTKVEINSTVSGTGLGLVITKKLIDIMNGNIEVKSEEGKGTTFIVNIPQGIPKNIEVL